MVDFAAAVLPSETILAPPFLVDCGYIPQTSFDWQPLDKSLPWDKQISQEEAQETVRKMQQIWEEVRQNMM